LATTATGNNIRAYYDEYNDDDKDGVGKVLKAKTGWNQYDGDRKGNGTDEYGFAALPGGRHRTDADDDDDYSGETPYEDAGDVGTWWTATETDDEGNAYFMYISKYADDLVGNPYLDYKNYGFSVRCVMDGGVNKQASTQKTKRSSPTGGKPEIETVFVKGGTFKMGCTDDEKNCPDKYHQAHNVTLGDFHICKYEVTQKQWTQVMGDNPSGGVLGDDYPVNNISWYDIQEFIERLNAVTGKKYRLPTEAEWEYAARGGANGKGYKYSGSDNPDDVAWNIENSGGEPHPVGLNAPNELGLYDMTGNVWEFTGDWHGDYGADDRVNPTGPREGAARTARGCSWSEKPCRVYDRGYSIPGESSTDAGFRLVLLP
jgi:formylglycine-generating enzyme required for sulfatase activity